MVVPMLNLMVALWIKSVLNWAVLAVQRNHVSRSFVGMFCVGVAVSDLLLHLTLTGIFLAQDFQVAQLRVTRYHVCLLVEITSWVHGVLHWPVFIVAGLDALWIGRRALRGKRLLYVAAVVLLWALALLHVVLAPGQNLDPLGADHVTLQGCPVTPGSQSSQVAGLSLLMLAGWTCAAQGRWASVGHLRESLGGFLSTWRTFVVLLLFLVGSGTPVPAYLDLNLVWLSFIHSLQSALTLSHCSCSFCPLPGGEPRPDRSRLRNRGHLYMREDTSGTVDLIN